MTPERIQELLKLSEELSEKDRKKASEIGGIASCDLFTLLRKPLVLGEVVYKIRRLRAEGPGGIWEPIFSD